MWGLFNIIQACSSISGDFSAGFATTTIAGRNKRPFNS